jgi:hypothetical protein
MTDPMPERRPMSVYTAPAEVSWEQAAVEVLVYGRTETIGELEGDWQTALRRGGEVSRELRRTAGGLQSWQGPAGDVYRGKLADLASRLDGVESDCGGIVPALTAARQSLAAAQETMPVPSEAVDNLAWARLKGDGGPVGSGSFWAAAQRAVVGGATDIGARLSDKLRNWFTGEEAKARRIHAAVNGEYEQVDASAPKPGGEDIVRKLKGEDFNPTGRPGETPEPTPLSGSGGFGRSGVPSSASIHPFTGVHRLDPSGENVGPGDGSPSGTSPHSRQAPTSPTGGGPEVPSGGGLTGLAPSGGSAPAPFTQVRGVGAVQGGIPLVGGGALGPGLGVAVTPSLGAPRPGGSSAGGAPLPGAGSPGSRSGASSAPGSGTAAVAPMRAQGRTGTGQPVRQNTWLHEDEDVWGAETDAPPSVLGAE